MNNFSINKVGRKLQSLYFTGKLRINVIRGLPVQTSQDIKIFKKIFDNFISNQKINIFEWGSGFSTIYYAEYLRKKGIEFEWYSIDNNKIWHDKIKTKAKNNIKPHVHFYLKEFRPFWEKPGWGPIPPPSGVFCPKSENEKAYVEFPSMLNKKFDIVIIDARFRRHCLQTAKKVLAPKGIVIMHDAQKEHYHIGLDDFQYSIFLTSGSWYPFQETPNKVWVGSKVKNKIFKELKLL